MPKVDDKLICTHAMMMFYTGFGFLIPVIGLTVLMLTEWVSEAIMQDESFYQDHSWVILAGMICAAVITFILYIALMLRGPKIHIDPTTGEELQIHGHDSFMFIPVKWWPVTYVLLGLIFLLLRAGETGNLSPDITPPSTDNAL